MKNFSFQKKYGKELLKSEKRRVLILIIIFSAALAFRIFTLFVPVPGDEAMPRESLVALLIFPLLVILFELLSLFYINRKLKSAKREIPPGMQYLNAILEICVPSAVIFLIAGQFSSFNVLESPVVFIYFIYIILSTLRLNFMLSLLYGILSAVAYVVFSLTLYNQFSSSDAGRALVLLFSGMAAGFVARQIKSGIETALREAGKRHITENLFSQQLSPEIAGQLIRQGGKMESRRMQVAVLFVDIRNFTQFTLDKTPEEIVCYQNAFFDIVIDTIGRHGGIVNQILGDGCMATFGAPVQHPNPSLPAVMAARQLLDTLAEAIHAGKLPATRIGMGIHTGEAVTGNIGNKERQQYSITGNVVIMASRIEQLNKQLHSRLLVSEDVYSSLEDKNSVKKLYRDIPLKGFEEPVTVYQLA